jgi:hypothetical protein
MQKKLSYKKVKYISFLYAALLKGAAAALFTIFLYQFFYIEFIRSSVEDSAFDTISWFALSKQKTDTNSSNVFILMVDEKYLKSKNLLDENNETNYGYLLPRKYLSEIILSVDSLVEDIDEENYPRALFLDYDLSYLSDPHNRVASTGDLSLLNTLKKDRPYTIYLPMTSNYNYIYHSKDEKIQQLIDESKLQFISVGLTTSSDGVSRRFYPYENYKDRDKNDKDFVNIAISLYDNKNMLDSNISNTYAQKDISIIENRIIFKAKQILENKEYIFWQSNWNSLIGMSANYPLDMIYEDDLKNSVFMIGATHNESDDTFEIDGYSKEISGIEMHGNTLMTLYYLDGKLKRLPLVWSVLIVFFVISFIDFFLSLLFKSLIYKKVYSFIERVETKWIKSMLYRLVPSSRDDFFSMWLVLLSILCLIFISYNILLSETHYWFNWLIPSMMSLPYLIISGMKKLVKK